MSGTLMMPHMHTKKKYKRIYRACERRRARERMLSGRYMEGVGMYRWGREVQRGGSPVAAYMMRHALSRISSN